MTVSQCSECGATAVNTSIECLDDFDVKVTKKTLALHQELLTTNEPLADPECPFI
jgi:hypothetical protein